MAERLKFIKAFIFDWDGVFNIGAKNAEGNSSFNEYDSMGINLLRLNHYIRIGSCPYTAVITGENNKTSFSFADREHFQAVYFNAKNKINAASHFCNLFNIEPHEIAFIFDDVLDFSLAEKVGLRMMIGKPSGEILQDFAKRNNLVDYITHFSGGNNGVREVTDVLISASGLYDKTIKHRMYYTELYKIYIQQRNSINTAFYDAAIVS